MAARRRTAALLETDVAPVDMEPIHPYRPGAPDLDHPRPEEPEPPDSLPPDRRPGFWLALAEGLCWGVFFAGVWAAIWAAIFGYGMLAVLAVVLSAAMLTTALALAKSNSAAENDMG